MSPQNGTTFTDRQSETSEAVAPRRGRPPASREAVLAAADRLLAVADAPASVSMDDIAAAAGVGKGTLFRAFTNRSGLIGALFAQRSTPLRESIAQGPGPAGPGAAPAERFVAVLDALLCWKLEHPHLMLALDLTGAELLDSGFYRWIHGLLTGLVAEVLPRAGDAYAGFAAHAALGTMRIDLTRELRAGMGLSAEELRRAQADYARRLIAPAPAAGA